MLNRRWLAILLAILMLTSLLPVTALAENGAEDAASVYVTGEDTQPDDTENEEGLWDSLSMSDADDTDQIAVYAEVIHNYDESLTDGSTLSGTGIKVKKEYLLSGNITVTLKDLTIDLSDKAGKSPITLAKDANVTLVISGHVTLKGGNASTTTGAGAAINVPESATLTILSDHEDRSTVDADGKPTDTLEVYGGNAASGSDGSDALASQTFDSNSATTNLRVGCGGSGGGGAAAAIGGNGGDGGSGGVYGSAGKLRTTDDKEFFDGKQQVDGHFVSVAKESVSSIKKDAISGGSGASGGKAGAIRVVGFLNLTGSGGAAARGGDGGNGANSIWTDRLCQTVANSASIAVISGPGGGGGGGGGLAAPFIGSGGAGGSGGGSGGVMDISIYTTGQTIPTGTTWSGGGGGGGGWPNGGGGGAGSSASYRTGVDDQKPYISTDRIHVAASAYENGDWGGDSSSAVKTDYEVSSRKIRVYKIVSPGVRGTGSGVGETGKLGGSPKAPGGTDEWNVRVDLSTIIVANGSGGAGGAGRTSNTAASGGTIGNKAGDGGGAVAFSPWDEDNSLILATSVKMPSSTYIANGYTNKGGCRGTDSATCFGAGDGYVDGGVVAAKFPHMLYDLRDCEVDFSNISYECRVSGYKCSGNDAHYYHGNEHYPYMANLKVKYNSTSDSGNYLSTCFYYDSASDSFVGQNEVIAYRGGSNLVDCPGKVVVIGSTAGRADEILEPPFDYPKIFTRLDTSGNAFAMPDSTSAQRLFIGMVETTIGIQQSTLKQVDMIGGTTTGGNDLNDNKSVYIKDKLYFDAGLYSGSALGSTLNYTYGSKGPLTVDITTIAPENTGGKIYQWTVKKDNTVVATSNEKNPTYTPTAPGTYTVTLSLKDMLNFEDIDATLAGDTSNTITFTVKQQVTPKIDSDSDIHTGATLTASVDNSDPNVPSIPDGVVTGYKWTYGDGTTLAENSATYTVTAQDVANKSITVEPIIATNYQALYEAVSTNITGMLDHSYTDGFCTINKCGEYEPAAQDSDSVYQIKNAGNLYWFAAKVNGDMTHAQGVTAQANAKAKLTADINLASKHNPNANNEWTPIGNTAKTWSGNVVTDGGFSGTFDGDGHTVERMYISTANNVLGFVGYLASNGQVKNLTVSGSINTKNTYVTEGKDTGIGGIVGHASGSAAISGVMSDVTITGSNLFHVGGIVGCMRGKESTLTKSFYGIPYSDTASLPTITLTESRDSIGGVVGCTEGTIKYCGNLASSISVKSTSTEIFLVGGIAGQAVSHGAILNSFSYSVLDVSTDTTEPNSGMGLLAGRCTGGSPCTTVTSCVGLTTGNTISTLVGGGNQEGQSKIEGMTAAEFQSGAACYLLNDNTSDKNNVWRQNIDNGNGPENYPHLTTAANDIVYYHRDGTYSNSQEVVSVTITWGSMDFTYTPGQWDTDKLVDNHTWTTANNADKKVTVTNTGNTAVNAAFTFVTADKFDEYGLTGTLTTASGTLAPSGTANDKISAELEITSKTIPESAFGGKNTKAQIGTVTVKLTVGS